MTRKEEIERHMITFVVRFGDKTEEDVARVNYIRGAEWADANPKKNQYTEFEQVINATALVRIKSLESMLAVAEWALERFDRNVAERHEATEALSKIAELRGMG